MKDRPILFSAPMVMAIIDGRKMQTRRVIKPQPSGPFNTFGMMSEKVRDKFVERGQRAVFDAPKSEWFDDDHPKREFFKCPYGQPGDRLWVRETWAKCDCGQPYCTGTLYRADGEPAQPNLQWKPSIHMFREDSRITIEVTSVRVERLQDISEADARGEGIYEVWPGRWHWQDVGFCDHETARDAYRTLWESINGPGSWDANPYVWVVEFKKLDS